MRHCVVILSETGSPNPKLIREYESAWEDLTEQAGAQLSAMIADFLGKNRQGPGSALPDGVTVADVAAAVAHKQNT